MNEPLLFKAEQSLEAEDVQDWHFQQAAQLYIELQMVDRAIEIVQTNPQKLAERILELSINKPLCEKMGKRSRQIIENEFSIANCVAGVTAVYQEVLKA